MRNITLYILLLCFSTLFSESPNVGVSDEKMAVYKLMMDKKNILTFVTHPKALEYFLSEAQGKKDYTQSLNGEIELLREQFHSDACVEQFLHEYNSSDPAIFDTIPLIDSVMAFLAYGIGDFSGLEPQELVKTQEFQVKLFKNYLDRQIGNSWTDYTPDLEKFSRHSSDPLLSQITHPILQALLKRDADIDDLTIFFVNLNSREKLSEEQREELKDVFDSERIKINFSGINFKFDDQQLEEIERALHKYYFPCGQEKCEGREAIAIFIEKYHDQQFFSLDRLSQVFLEVLKDSEDL